MVGSKVKPTTYESRIKPSGNKPNAARFNLSQIRPHGLALTAGFGLGQLGSTSPAPDAQFTAYDWSVGLAGGPNTFLIRDTTDEIAIPVEQHKYPIETENGFGEECAGRVKHLLGHYYVCTF